MLIQNGRITRFFPPCTKCSNFPYNNLILIRWTSLTCDNVRSFKGQACIGFFLLRTGEIRLMKTFTPELTSWLLALTGHMIKYIAIVADPWLRIIKMYLDSHMKETHIARHFLAVKPQLDSERRDHITIVSLHTKTASTNNRGFEVSSRISSDFFNCDFKRNVKNHTLSRRAIIGDKGFKISLLKKTVKTR